MKRIIYIFIALFALPFLGAHAQSNTNSVDLLWQGNTYTPPFYEGRALWSKQSKITFTAIPHIFGANGQRLDPSTLIYRWSKDGTIYGDASGIGVNTFSFVDSIFSKPQTVTVAIIQTQTTDTIQDTVLASESAALVPTKPSLSVYEISPLYGPLFNKDISDSFALKNKEVSFGVFPFFFSTPGVGSSILSYAWRTGGGQAATTNRVTYRAPDGASGDSAISIKVTHKDKASQEVEKRFIVQFSHDPSI
jgi:hypothetical protein